MAVEIAVGLSQVVAKAPLRALADVTLKLSDGEITIRRCAVFEKASEPPWASLPRLAIEKRGKREFVPLIDLAPVLKKRVLESVLAEYRRAKTANGETSSPCASTERAGDVGGA